MGGGGGGDTENTIRYAPYLEAAHGRLLDHGGSDQPKISFMDAFNATVGTSPYGNYALVDVDSGYLGPGYSVNAFPSLWDMFGKFMAGLDVHVLWGQIYEDVIQGPEIENAVAAQAALVQDDIDTTIMPKFLAGMRDINSVQASAFVIGKAIIQSTHIKSINKFASQIKIHALTMSNDQWSKHLDWNSSVIRTFSEMFKLYYSSKLDLDRANLEYQAKDNMWDINLFDNARSILGAMAGSAASAGGGNEPSQVQKAIGGAAAGAAAGAAFGPWGAVIGGILGLALSFL